MAAPHKLLAALLPATILTLSAWAAGAFEPIDASLRPLAEVSTGAKLSAMKPDSAVVVLGNSQASSAVDPVLLGASLHEQGRVAMMALPGLSLMGTYVILKNRVFGAGFHPRLVVVPMSLLSLLDVAPPSEIHLAWMREHMPGDDPAVAKKVLGRAVSVLPDGFSRAVSTAQVARDAWFEALTRQPLRLVGADDPAARLDAARDAVLGEVAGANLAMAVNVLPAVARPTAAVASEVGLDDTLLPELVALCKENGAQLVVSTVPQKVSLHGANPDTARRTAAWLQERGVPFLHLESVDVPADGWLDPGHLMGSGQRAYTEALAAKLGQVGALGKAPLQMPSLPIAAPHLTRTGDMPPPAVRATAVSADGCFVKMSLPGMRHRSDAGLAALGLGQASVLQARVDGQLVTPHIAVREADGCTNQMWHGPDSVVVALPRPGVVPELSWAGTLSSSRVGPRADLPIAEDLLWVPPGTTLQFRWDDPQTAAAFDLVAVETAPGTRAPVLQLAGAEKALVAWDKIWAGEMAVENGTLGDPVSLVNPVGGPELFVRVAALAGPDGQRQLAHGRAMDVGWSLVMAGSPTSDVTPAFPTAPVATGGSRQGDTMSFAVSGPLTAVTQSALGTLLGDTRMQSCMPLAVKQRSTGAYREAVVQLQPGTLIARGLPGDDWDVVWRSRRTCFQRAWGLAGETLTFTPKAPRGVYVATQALQLDVVAMPAVGTARVRVLMGDEVMLDTSLDLTGPRPVTLPLDKPIPAGPAAVRMEVTAPPDVMISVGNAELRPTEVPEWAWFTRAERPAEAE